MREASAKTITINEHKSVIFIFILFKRNNLNIWKTKFILMNSVLD